MTTSTEISLTGKIAFISGASKGIGVSIAESFAAAGVDLALTARNEQELEQTAENTRKHGVRVWTRTAELSDADDVKALAGEVLEENQFLLGCVPVARRSTRAAILVVL